MSRYDVTLASDLALLAAVRAVLGGEHSGALPFSATTRRCLEAFAALLVDDPTEGFHELQALRAECRVKTRAEYDREIGDKARASLQSGEWDTDPFWLKGLRALVDQSRSAPEDEP